MAELHLENVSKVYPGGMAAVDNLCLHADDGELLVLVGPSGCGKTTTLRLIAGLETVGQGSIRIGTNDVGHLPPDQRDVAMVFQHDALYPHWTVAQNLAFGLKLRRVPKPEREQQVRWAATALRLENLVDRMPHTLSGGERRRVALGRAIVRRPQLFLLDEPLTNLDANLRVELRTLIKQLHRQLGTTTVYVTHDQQEAMALGDRVVVMSHGSAQQHATPGGLYDRPANRFVASFVGMPPMSFISGQLAVDANGSVTFDSADLTVCLHASQTAAARPHVGRAIVLGIRPEAFCLSPSAPAVEAWAGELRVTVDLVERFGAWADVYGHTHCGERVALRVDEESLRCGDTVMLGVDARKSHLFEPDLPADRPGGPPRYGRNLCLVNWADSGENSENRV